ncbi:hypothetical protein BZA77DRAFT_304447 [Pyronema omphalodes]|nr:hypothetical protein BZA77DRAFT_304447 [Pyronema omphalodes]
MSLWKYLVVATAWTTALAQQYDPKKDFCRRFSHEAAVINNRLYINDGQLNLPNKGGQNFTNERLLFHDLDVTVSDSGKPLDMPILRTNLSKPAEVPSVIGGILWADGTNGRLFQYGGEYPDASVMREMSFQLWTYDTYFDKWSTRDPTDRSITRLSFGAGTSVEHLGMGYYLGGYQSDRSNVNWQGGRKAMNKLLEYNMEEDVWANRTGPADGKGRAEGTLHYVPFGDKGMLLNFGGIRIGMEDGAKEEFLPMDTIDIYDMGSQKWYTQNATGDIPEPRRRFCGGVATAESKLSSNIYIYGGLGFGVNSTGFDDVYVLTVPSFKWIKLYPIAGPKAPTNGTVNYDFPHYDLTCSVIKNAQMMVIGGQFPKDPNAKNCDAPDIWGQHNLVLSKVDGGSESYYWGKYIPDRNRYSVPSDIRNIIGGDEKGLSSQPKPDKGFNSPEVERLFGRPVAIVERQPTRSAPTGPKKTSGANDDGPFSTNAKRATILVPIIVGLLLLGGLAAFFILRRRKKTAYSAAPQDQPPVYKARDSGAPGVLAPVPQYPPGSTSPTAGNWVNNNSIYSPPPHPHPPLDQSGQYATGIGGYSPRLFHDFGDSPVTPGGGIQQAPVELPQGHTPAPEVEGWSPPPLPRSPGSPVRLGSPANGSMSGQIQGHYPPPLPEGFEQRQRSPEMKEVNPPGSARGAM